MEKSNLGERISLIIPDERKNSILSFTKVTFEDQALYLCAVGDTVSHPHESLWQEPFLAMQLPPEAGKKYNCEDTADNLNVPRSTFAMMIETMRTLFCQAENPVQEPLIEASNGREVDLNCSHPNIKTNENIVWYRLFPSQPPNLIATGYKGKEQSNLGERISLIIPDERKNSILSFTKVTFEDQALYLCALAGSTVSNSGYNKVIFGSGTRLVVRPELTNSNPSVYQLKPKEKESNLAACLITDYSPGPIDVKFNSSLEPEAVNDSAVVVKEDGNKESASLGVVIWSKNKDQFQCSAIHRGDTYKAEKEGDATCSETLSDTPVFETDENLNLLSLTVLGLRLIFFKSVALNLILTFWAWSR
ncbi:M1-specific T cell receptor alpha chain-like [Pituophis catenifer annectens]|uniref:M1-specific T cell receptor alpha chain-like n=1 Tax=Pituophis catenifer annectens TaxID=94852 RepID=UPI0039964ADD